MQTFELSGEPPGSSAPAPANETPRGGVKTMFSIFVMTMIAVNYDSGASAATLLLMEKGCNTTIVEGQKLKNPSFDPDYPCLISIDQAMLGALPYLGLCVGCPIAGRLLSSRSETLVLVIGLSVNVLATFTFGYVIQKWALFTAKFLIGVTQSAVCVYLPVWVDHFAPETQRNTWLGIVQGVGGLGAMVGYGATYMVTCGIWYQWVFRIQGIGIMGCIVAILLAPTNLVSASAHATILKQAELRGIRATTRITSATTRITSFKPDAGAMTFIAVGDLASKGGFCEQARPLLQNTIFMSTALGVCCLFFAVTGIQFWATKFFIVCYIREELEVKSIFLFVSLTAPVMGVLLGGTIVDKVTGGAMVPTARLVRYWAVVAVIAGISACAVPTVPDSPHDDPEIQTIGAGWFYLGVACIWVLLLFGAMMLPPCTGLILQSVQESEKTIANAASMLLYNVFGYALGSFLPGAMAGSLMKWKYQEAAALAYSLKFVFFVGAVGGFVACQVMYSAVLEREGQIGARRSLTRLSETSSVTS